MPCAVACRWALYAGSGERAVHARELWTSPSHGLLRMSCAKPHLPGVEAALLFDAEKNLVRNHAVNADGWGIGWYEKENDGSVVARRMRSGSSAGLGVQVSTSQQCDDHSKPVKPEPMLAQALSKYEIRSNIIFSHVRASTDAESSSTNSHPFRFGKSLLWMHNGGIANKSRLVDRCSEKGSDFAVAGDTDTEYAGALFAQNLLLPASEDNVCSGAFSDDLEGAIIKTLSQIQADDDCALKSSGSSLNFAASNGKTVVATRYRTCIDEEPPSLYYSVDSNHGSLWCASEPLDFSENAKRKWHMLAKDQMITFDAESGEHHLRCLSDACQAELTHRLHKSNSEGQTTTL